MGNKTVGGIHWSYWLIAVDFRQNEFANSEFTTLFVACFEEFQGGGMVWAIWVRSVEE